MSCTGKIHRAPHVGSIAPFHSAFCLRRVLAILRARSSTHAVPLIRGGECPQWGDPARIHGRHGDGAPFRAKSAPLRGIIWGCATIDGRTFRTGVWGALARSKTRKGLPTPFFWKPGSDCFWGGVLRLIPGQLPAYVHSVRRLGALLKSSACQRRRSRSCLHPCSGHPAF